MDLEYLAEILLILHLTLSFTSLFAGTVSIIARKSKSVHKLYGGSYVYLIAASTLSAMVIMLIPGHENQLMFLIGLFTLYITISGKRSLKFKVIFDRKKIPFLDYAISVFAFLLGIYMAYFGFQLYSYGDSWGVALAIFGTVSVILSVLDFRLFRSVGKSDFLWMEYHSAKMVGSYIGTVTAFSVTQFEENFGLIAWLAPSMLGAIHIIFWSFKIKRNPISVFDN